VTNFEGFNFTGGQNSNFSHRKLASALVLRSRAACDYNDEPTKKTSLVLCLFSGTNVKAIKPTLDFEMSKMLKGAGAVLK